jgi:SAM-dependent methyltransferase
MNTLQLPQLADVPMMDHFLAEKGLHNYEMDRHTRLIYHPLYGFFYRKRFAVALEMLAAALDDKECCVEVGYSAGLMLPSLSKLARNLVGVDTIEPRAAALVRAMLEKMRVSNVSLLQGSVSELPLQESSVDGLICLSVLEHLQPNGELGCAAQEILRVLRPGGVAVLGFPVKNPMTKVMLRVAGVDDEEVHPSSHRDIISKCRLEGLQVEKLRRMPGFLPLDLGMYTVVQLRRQRPH